MKVNENASIKDLKTVEEMLPALELEAANKELQVFIFYKEDLEKIFKMKYNDLAVITLSKSLEGANWNIQNYKHSYLAKTK